MDHVLQAVSDRIALNAARAAPLPEDHQHLVLARGVLRTPDGEVHVDRIGKGAFAVVYRDKQDPSRVFAVTSDETPDKEIAAGAHEALPDNPHLPAFEKFGETADSAVYEVPWYRAPLRKTDSPAAWRDFVAVRECFNAARRSKLAKGAIDPHDFGYSLSYDAVECVKARVAEGRLTSAVAEALETLMNQAANYGATFGFEFVPRNFATDADGNLVLLDVLADWEVVARKNAEKRRRVEQRGQYRGW